MQTDRDYWKKLDNRWTGETGYYWFKDNPKAEPEITHVTEGSDGILHFSFAFGYDEECNMTIPELLSRFHESSEISVERIKPPNEKPEPREWWINDCRVAFATEQDAKTYCSPGFTPIHVREVLR